MFRSLSSTRSWPTTIIFNARTRFIRSSSPTPRLLASVAATGTLAAYLFWQHPFKVNSFLLEPLTSSPILATEPRIDPSSNVEFPTKIQLPSQSSSGQLCLVGLGVRTVSFISIKVYCAGLYLEEGLLRRLGAIPGWEKFTMKDYLASSKQASVEDGNSGSESFLRKVLDEPTNVVIRIVPTRTTDFIHLRDGFVRAVTARLKKQGKFDQVGESLQQFQSLFPKRQVPKGTPLLIIRDERGGLAVEYDGTNLGRVDNSLIANELVLAYFANDQPISAPFKESVGEGFASILQPPS